jgi:hypothetical protein
MRKIFLFLNELKELLSFSVQFVSDKIMVIRGPDWFEFDQN